MISLWVSLLCVLCISGQLFATLPTKPETEANRERVDTLIEKNLYPTPQCISVPEGGFVYVFHPDVTSWIEKQLDADAVKSIAAKLKPYLKLTLTKEGFAPASTRYSEDQVDPTQYNAIWVRDCVWQYFALKIQNRDEARRLALSLLRFYSTPDQIKRFQKVIADPSILDTSKNPNAAMDVPLIRFSSKTLTHYLVDGKPQRWNHLQFDSHGLFLLLVADGLTSGIISTEDLTKKNLEVLALFPVFFKRTQYWKKGDAGPWEEELLWNASSAGIVASGIQQMGRVVAQNKGLEKIKAAYASQNIAELVNKGRLRVEKDLRLGGEAPNFTGTTIDRTADAALLFLLVPGAVLYADSPERIKQILNIDGSLISPYGVNRYQYDAYQAANFWIDFDVSSKIVGPVTKFSLFATRLKKGFMPSKNAYSAQWFFDSIIAQVYYNLSKLEKGSEAKRYYLGKGDLHLKRSLGQLTGPTSYASNGEKLPPLQLAESVNTVIDASGQPFPAHSPICPLGWATAALQMALSAAEEAHAELPTLPAPLQEKPELDFESL